MKPIIYSSLLFLLIITSCINDDRYVVKNSSVEDINVTVTVRVPSQTSGITTYAMDNASENHLETIDVLAFEVASDGKEYFRYKASASSIDQNNGANEKKFNVTLIKKNYQQRLVIIANAHDQLEELGEIQQTGVKEEVLKRLIFKNEDEWNSTSSSNFTPFPMWGESDPVNITDATTSIGTIKVLRMVARIDVQISPDAIGDFKLRTVSLFNRKTRGHIVANTESSNWDHTERKALKATMPDDNDASSPLTILGPLTYKEATTSDSAFIQTIYTFEAAAPSLSEASKATCLVVGGLFENDSDPSYYRLDFVDKDDNDKITGYKDVLRNHLYKVNIVEISGRGYDNEEDAFNSKPMNMECIVREWDQGEFGEIVFDGQYLLAVDPGEFRLTREERHGNTIKIYTDVPTGWKATPENGCNWLELTSSDTGPTDTNSTLTFKVTHNDTGAERETYIKISAGRLNYIVKVIQTLEDEFSLTVTDINKVEITQLVFSADPDLTYAPMSHDIYVSWVPTSVFCPVSSVHLESPFVHASVDPAQGQPLQGGAETLTIEADPMKESDLASNPFLTRVTSLNFTVTHNSSYLMKSVILKQTNYTVIPEGIEDSYLMDGSEYEFLLKSNANWTAEIATGDDPDKILVSFPSSGLANEAGEQFKFKLINDEQSLGTAEAYITFKSPEGKFKPKRVKIVGTSPVTARSEGEANCYILASGGDAIEFPVSQANADGTQRLTASTEFTVDLLWTDNANFFGPNAVVANYTRSGKGRDAKITVTSGSAEGNAVIALKVNGEIRWSWHIWVANFDPEQNTGSNQNFVIMDRNLGAISSAASSTKNFGLLYQWGRKDPFPGASSKNNNTPITIYTAANTPANVTPRQVNNTNNLENSIKNPMVFYLGGAANTMDWYTTSNNQNNNLWNIEGYEKSAYDPCPYGWRTSVTNQPGLNTYGDLWGDKAPEQDNTNQGVIILGSFYPRAGYLVPDTGVLTNVGTTGNYWSASSMSIDARGINLVSWGIDNSYSGKRATGNAVRCVKDNNAFK